MTIVTLEWTLIRAWKKSNQKSILQIKALAVAVVVAVAVAVVVAVAVAVAVVVQIDRDHYVSERIKSKLRTMHNCLSFALSVHSQR